MGIKDGELLLISRLRVEEIILEKDEYKEIDPTLDDSKLEGWEFPGTELLADDEMMEVRFDQVLDSRVTDQLVLASRDGKRLHIRRDAKGRKRRVTLVFETEKISWPDAAMKANDLGNHARDADELTFVDGAIQPLDTTAWAPVVK